ncbi:MAG: hypothetical protein AABY95_03710 [Pseudomonadota bacterium]
MSKEIISIGYVIPGHGEHYVDFQDSSSLMDADVLLISPHSITPRGDWVSFTSGDDGCYNVGASNSYKQKVAHLKKEIEDHLKAGKNVFIFLTKEETASLSSGVSSPRKGENTYSTYTSSNYEFLPINIGRRTSASGRHIQFSGDSRFGNFYKTFKNNLEYHLYVEATNGAQIVFTGKDKSKILGAIYGIGPGHLVTLPTLTFDEQEFSETREKDGQKQEFWNKKGVAFGNSLVECLLTIDESLASESEKSIPPDWVSKEVFLGKKEKDLSDAVKVHVEELGKIQQRIESVKRELEAERKLKDLLFEQGKPLESAVIKALKLLGYKAENYDDGNLEMDQVVISPENHRYIGETEGKDSKDINVTKFRQLLDALNADFAREEVKEKAFGILFGNAERLIEPEKRKLDFTEKCRSGAEREKVALVRTIDLFAVAKYLNESNDETFRKNCRDAIHRGLGKMVEFPAVPDAPTDNKALHSTEQAGA